MYGPDENKEGSYQKCMHVLNFYMSLVAHRLFSTDKAGMFSRSGSRLSTMRVTRRIVLTLITKRSTILAVLKIKFGGF